MLKKSSLILKAKFLPILLFVLLVFPRSASAEWWNPLSWIGNAAIGIAVGVPIGLISILSYVIMTAVALISGLIGAFMNWVITASLNMPIFSGVDFVEAGWGITRDLMNMVFILILVFIGLATILRIKSYEVQKTLPLLIVIALLINFSGVLVGVIVDFSNLVTNFFISGIGTDGFNFSFKTIGDAGNDLGQQLIGLFVNLSGNATDYITSLIQPLVKIIVIIAFYVVLDIVLFAITLIFLLRIVFLWILVILAPLAFASYVLPATRGLWKGWWKNLIQWSIVGIPISFFLYLASKIIITTVSQNISDNFTKTAGAAGGDFLGALIFSLLSPIVVIVLLMYGIGASIAGAPAGAKNIMQAANKGIIASGSFLRKRAWQGTKNSARQQYERLGRTATMYRNDFNSAKGFRGKTKAAFGGLFTSPAKVIKEDYNEILNREPKEGEAKPNRTQALMGAINQTGIVGKIIASPYNIADSAVANFKNEIAAGNGITSAFKGAVKAGAKNQVANGIWGAIRDASREGWKAATKKKKTKNMKIGDTVVEVEEVDAKKDDKNEEKKT